MSRSDGSGASRSLSVQTLLHKTTRGYGILFVAATLASSTGSWPTLATTRSSSGNGSNPAWGFVAALPPQQSVGVLRAVVRSKGGGRSLGCGFAASAAASTPQLRLLCDGGMKSSSSSSSSSRSRSSGSGSSGSGGSLLASHMAVGPPTSTSHSRLNRAALAPAVRRAGEGGRLTSYFLCNQGSRACDSGINRAATISTPPALALAAFGRGSGESRGEGGVGGASGIDPESVARAREAAKNNDYDWFMEFIGGDEEEEVDDGVDVGGYDSSNRKRGPEDKGRSTRSGGLEYGNYGTGERSSLARDGGSGYMREEVTALPARAGLAPPNRGRRGRRPPPSGREQEFYNNGVSADGRRKGKRPKAPADSAYDYDFDEEFDGEPGRGGWDYDPGISAGISARQRDVDIAKVRAKTKPASMRMPLEVDQEVRGRERSGGQRQGDLDGGDRAATAADFEPVGPEKAKVLTGDLGYTEQEVACMDPDMADLAIERGVRRPASGMPADWAAVGTRPPPPQSSPTPASTTAADAASVSRSSQTYFGAGTSAAAGGSGVGGVEGQDPGVDDGGALDLDAILRDGFEYGETGVVGATREGARRTRSRRSNMDDWGREPPSRGRQRRRGGGGGGVGADPPYLEGVDGDRRRREAGGGYRDDGNDYEYDYYGDDYVEEAPRRGRRGRGVGRYEGGYDDDMLDDRRGVGGGDGGGGERRRRARGRPRRKSVDGSAAEKFEREIFGGAPGGGEEGSGTGSRWGAQRRGAEDDDDEDDDDGGKLWTGVGPDGPWPTLEEFTELLREETEVRLSLVGPWAAEIVALENRFRLQAYEKWLEVLDKGIGETLEEAGIFDAAFVGEDDDDGDDDGYGYTNAGGSGGGRDGRREWASSRRGRPDVNNLYDTYTNYGSGSEGAPDDDERKGGVSGSRGRGDRRGSGYYDSGGDDGDDYDDRFSRGQWSGERKERGSRTGSSSSSSSSRGPALRKFDVGSFLRSGAQGIMQPGEGMEEKAARFEQRYPGRTRSNVLENEAEGASGGGGGGRKSSGSRRPSNGRLGDDDDEEEEDVYRRRRRNREGGDGRGAQGSGSPGPGYLDEDEEEY